MGADEVGTLTALKGHRREVVDPAAAHKGRIVKTTGDGMLIEFASAVDAVTCAMSIQEKMAERNSVSSGPYLFFVSASTWATSSSTEMTFSVTASTWPHGLRMSATRVASIAANAFEQIRGKTQFTFDDLGERALRISTALCAFMQRNCRIILDVALVATTSAPDAKKPLPLPDKPSIAVFPFQNMSGDPEQEYFSDGMVEDIITGLSRFKSAVRHRSQFKLHLQRQGGRYKAGRTETLVSVTCSKAASVKPVTRSVSPGS